MKPLLSNGTRIRYIGPDITFPNAPDEPPFPSRTLGTITQYHGTAAELGGFDGAGNQYGPEERLYQIRWDTLEWGFAQFDSRIRPLD